jgi:hypothetical protein
MNVKKLIFLSVFLSVANVYAQDTTMHVNQVTEQISPVVTWRDEVYSSPSLHPFYRMYNYSLLGAHLEDSKKDLYLRQEGSGNTTLKINSESFLKNLKGISLWGKAYYTNDKIKQVNFNETLDYHYVYPYVMADTVGGNLNAESYYFGGGLSKEIGRLRYAIQGSFKGIQSFRNRDPRPKNISSDIDFSLSVAKQLAKEKAFSLDLNLQKYNQNNGLDFVNELGFPLVYHDAGLGVYNELLAGSRTQAYYKGLRLGAQLNFVPTNLNGFSAQIGFDNFNLSKELSSINDKIAEVNDNNIHLLLAYHHQTQVNSFIVKLKGYFTKREGIEATFSNTGGASLYKVSNELRYNNEKLGIQLHAAYGKTTKNLNWYFGFEGIFSTDKESYLLPDRFMDYQTASAGVFASLTKPLGKTLLTFDVKATQLTVLNSNFDWDNVNPRTGIYQMLNANYAYLTSDILTITSALRCDFPLNNKLGAFAKAKGAYANYNENNNAQEFIFSIGVIF